MSSREIGLYIHIPFCAHKCNYCDFVSFGDKLDKVDKYIEKLKSEIISYKLEQYEITTIYIGGGTPSYINSKYIEDILSLINKEKAQEITLEVNPGTSTKDKLKSYKNAGINRLSIGLQSTNNNLLKQIGRIHTYEEFLETYKIAREIGFRNINVDLMIGLPNQTTENVKETLEKIIQINPEHISVYSLIVEEGTKLKEQLEKKEFVLPTEEDEREMYWNVKKMLEEVGYMHYEISNFAKPNFYSRHNTNCWEQKEYIGIGLAAHSYMNKTRYSNTEILEKYLEDFQKNRTIHEVQDIQNEQKEYMLLGLRKIEGVCIQEFKNKFTQSPIYLYKYELNKLVKHKLIEIDTNYIKLTKKGINLANLVWEEFI